MGQYYKPLILTDEKKIERSFRGRDFNNGLKLMEHSYFDNTLMNAVENHLISYPSRLVWAGDYSDKDFDGKGNNAYTAESILFRDEKKPIRVKPDMDNTKDLPKNLFVVNNTKKEYYSRDKMKELNSDGDKEWPLSINPLSLLTMQTDNSGGGDYYGEENRDLLGRWAEDEIEITIVPPETGYPDYKEIVPIFHE